MTALQLRTPTLENRDHVHGVAVKALVRVLAAWKVGAEASAFLAGVPSTRTWARMKSGTWAGSLTQDQFMRASAIVGVYKSLHLYFGDTLADSWVLLPNSGPLFRGLTPCQYMVDGGLPAILEVREYIDAVRGGM